MNVDHILRTFADCGVEYLLIGGMNFLLRHEPVLTYDIDFWIHDTAENLDRCAVALQQLDAAWGPTEADWRPVAAPPGFNDMVPSLPDDFLARDQPFTVGTTGTAPSTSLRVGVSRANSTIRIVGFPLDTVDATTAALLRNMVVATAAIGAMLLLVGLAVIRLGVRPLRLMTDAATDLAGGAGGVELPMFPLGSEAHRLGTALGALVDQKNQALEQTRRFIADASHELRTPLTTIVGYASLHEERRLDSGAATQDALDRIGQEGYRMQRIVDGLIQLALLDERPSLDVTPFDLGGLVNSVVNDFAITTTTHAFRTAAEAGHLTISSDQDRVRQVLVALVNNAAHH